MNPRMAGFRERMPAEAGGLATSLDVAAASPPGGTATWWRAVLPRRLNVVLSFQLSAKGPSDADTLLHRSRPEPSRPNRRNPW